MLGFDGHMIFLIQSHFPTVEHCAHLFYSTSKVSLLVLSIFIFLEVHEKSFTKNGSRSDPGLRINLLIVYQQWAQEDECPVLHYVHAELLHEAFSTVQSVDVGTCVGRHCHIPSFLIIRVVARG